MTADDAWWADRLPETWPTLGKVSLQRLPGEFDTNYRVLNGDRFTHVLKVMRPGCDVALVDLQCRAHAHLAASDSVPVPGVVATSDGSLFAEIAHPGGAGLVWVIDALPGVEFAQLSERRPVTLANLGQTVGRMSRALQSFDHDYLDRSFKWRLDEAGWVRSELGGIPGAADRELVERVLDRFDNGLLDELLRRPQVPTHNDLNDLNVMVAQTSAGDWVVSGIIDFGDMTRGTAVGELAITAAYALMGADRPLDALTHLVRGFHEELPLDEADIDLVLPLVRLRLATSVVNSAMMKRQRPDDPNVVVSEAEAWTLLHLLQRVDDAAAIDRLRAACQASQSHS